MFRLKKYSNLKQIILHLLNFVDKMLITIICLYIIIYLMFYFCLDLLKTNLMGTETAISLNLSSKKIVIVEDDFYSIRYYEMILSNTGADIQVLRSGLEFVEYIKEGGNKIDIILMDFLIPFITGAECTRIYRKINKETPIIMLTAYTSELTKTEAFIAGCNEYITKPIYSENLMFLLEKYLVSNKALV